MKTQSQRPHTYKSSFIATRAVSLRSLALAGRIALTALTGAGLTGCASVTSRGELRRQIAENTYMPTPENAQKIEKTKKKIKADLFSLNPSRVIGSHFDAWMHQGGSGGSDSASASGGLAYLLSPITLGTGLGQAVFFNWPRRLFIHGEEK